MSNLLMVRCPQATMYFIIVEKATVRLVYAQVLSNFSEPGKPIISNIERKVPIGGIENCGILHVNRNIQLLFWMI